jgi:hypothetical protein
VMDLLLLKIDYSLLWWVKMQLLGNVVQWVASSWVVSNVFQFL